MLGSADEGQANEPRQGHGSCRGTAALAKVQGQDNRREIWWVGG